MLEAATDAFKEKNMNEYTEELLKEEINNTCKNSNTIKEYKKWKQENKK